MEQIFLYLSRLTINVAQILVNVFFTLDYFRVIILFKNALCIVAAKRTQHSNNKTEQTAKKRLSNKLFTKSQTETNILSKIHKSQNKSTVSKNKDGDIFCS